MPLRRTVKVMSLAVLTAPMATVIDWVPGGTVRGWGGEQAVAE